MAYSNFTTISQGQTTDPPLTPPKRGTGAPAGSEFPRNFVGIFRNLCQFQILVIQYAQNFRAILGQPLSDTYGFTTDPTPAS